MNIYQRTLLLAPALSALVAVGLPATPALAAQSCLGVRATIVGTAGADEITGTAGRDVIVGLGGNDEIKAGSGDVVCGGDGHDKIRANGSRARLSGDGGDDLLQLTGSRGALLGGAGRDKLRGGKGNDQLRGGSGNDVLLGGDGVDRAYGDAGNDTLRTGPGILDELWGGNGNDQLAAESGASQVYGEAGDDRLWGTASSVVYNGGSGNDVVTGGPFDDEIDGSWGNDTLLGGAGTDSCIGGDGIDTCDGGSPGPQENTPTDPDTCADDVETKFSCRVEGLPARWTATLEGTTTYAPHPDTNVVTSWTMTVVLEAQHENQGVVQFGDVSGTGSYSTEGHAGGCSITGGDTFDETDMSIWMTIDPGADTIMWDWNGVYQADTLWHCPDGDIDRDTPVDAKDWVEGLPYTPDETGSVVGHRVVEGSNFQTHDYTWVITPLE